MELSHDTVILLVNIHSKDSKESCNNIVCCLYSLKSLMLIKCNSTVHRYCPQDSGPKYKTKKVMYLSASN